MKTKLKALVWALVALLGATTPAFAEKGTVKVHDSVGLLTKDDVKSLENESKWQNFELHVLIKNAKDISAAAQKAVTGDDVIAIGIDPQGHKTVVKYGPLVKVPSNVKLSGLGDPFFANKQWQQGIRAIADGAGATVIATQPIDIRTTTPEAEARSFQQDSGHPLLWGFLIFLGLGGLAFLAWRFFSGNGSRKTYDGDDIFGSNQPVRTGYAPAYQQLPPRTMPAGTTAPVSSLGLQPALLPRTVHHHHTTPVVVQQPAPNTAADILLGMELGRLASQPAPQPPAPAPITTPKSDESNWSRPSTPLLSTPSPAPKEDTSDWGSNGGSIPKSDESLWNTQAASNDDDDASSWSKSSSSRTSSDDSDTSDWSNGSSSSNDDDDDDDDDESSSTSDSTPSSDDDDSSW